MSSELAISNLLGDHPGRHATLSAKVDATQMEALASRTPMPDPGDALAGPATALQDPRVQDPRLGLQDARAAQQDPRAALQDPRAPLPALREPTVLLQRVSSTDLPPDTVKRIAAALGVDPAEVPRLVEAASNAFAAKGVSLEPLLREAAQLGIDESQGLAMLVALAFPERFSAAADYTPACPGTPEQAVLSMYVMATLTDALGGDVPAPEAMRFASVAAEKLSRLDPRDVLFVAEGIPRLIGGMGGSGRIETTTAIAALLHSSPETVARVVREGHELTVMHRARTLAADAHASRLDVDRADHAVRGGRLEAERADAVHEAEVRGLAVAAAFVVLASTDAPEAARNLYARAVAIAGSAAPRIVLSTAARQDDNDFYRRLDITLEQLHPFLDNYDRLRAQMVQVNAVPRVELCNALHVHLASGSAQFYLALLGLLKRHTALCTRPGSRALRTALRRHDIRVQSGTTTWEPAGLV